LLLIVGLAGLVVAFGLVALDRYERQSDAPPLASEASANRLVVDKTDRTLTLFQDERPLKTYRVALGRGEPGAKRQEGDGKTPEGSYRIVGRNPRSGYHLSLRVSYPEAEDISIAKRIGAPPGGDIMIHGLKNGLGFVGAAHRLMNWTDGCIAVTNDEMDEIWRVVRDGSPIEIRP
jgi:murein L,D-transpeptidase YafK